MLPIFDQFPPIDLPFVALLSIILVAGVARGLSGFGTGMIVAPVAGAIYGPTVAVALIVLIDTLPIIPVTVPALRIARWREVLPIALGLFALFPAGVWILVNSDETVLRWGICAIILCCVAMLWARWTWRGPRNIATSIGVGGVAGLMSGVAALPGPPVVAYWMTAGLPAALVRANMLVLFFIGEFVSIGNLWIAGLFEREVVMRALVAAPVYFIGLTAGSLAFSAGGERLYRIATFVLILLAAILSMPLFDGLFAAVDAQ